VSKGCGRYIEWTSIAADLCSGEIVKSVAICSSGLSVCGERYAVIGCFVLTM